MKLRRLGRTGLRVSEVGFGGAGIGHVWGSTSDAECIAAVRRAVELGINFFDTSPMYGAGRSEENLGLGLAGLRLLYANTASGEMARLEPGTPMRRR